jgi:peptidoglycan/xylan/chitin deacetylase (PgdA/CDA1 family)
LIEEFGISPILAVIPDNLDHSLELSPPDPEFWAGMRAMQAAGAAIALHGYQHICDSRGHSLLALHRSSEFAGVAEDVQRQWICAGLKILRSYGLNPKLWVAPRHGFDGNTLRVLREQGIYALSDGFARVPHMRGGLAWIPQQLWEPVDKPKGLWTICIHPNSAGSSLVAQLQLFLRAHAAQFTSVDRVLDELRPCKLCLAEWLYERLALWRARTAHAGKRVRRRPGRSSRS